MPSDRGGSGPAVAPLQQIGQTLGAGWLTTPRPPGCHSLVTLRRDPGRRHDARQGRCVMGVVWSINRWLTIPANGRAVRRPRRIARPSVKIERHIRVLEIKSRA
jgi:hypothetical protein